jgi:hypothetical protein
VAALLQQQQQQHPLLLQLPKKVYKVKPKP